MGWKIRGLDPEQWRRAAETLAVIGERYPIVIQRPMKPLAIGTGDRLSQVAAEMNLTEADIGFAMIRHTRSWPYLKAVAQGGARYSLDGEIEGEVEPSEAHFAQTVIAKRREREAAVEARSGSGRDRADRARDRFEATQGDAGFARVPEADDGEAVTHDADNHDVASQDSDRAA